MKRFLDYVTRFDPDFLDRIRGASAAEIDSFEQLAGRPLPPFYKDFLGMMGKNDGGLRLTPEGTTNIDDVVSYYTDEVKTGHFPLPPDSILIGFGAVSILDFALDCRSPGEPPVMFIDGDEVAGLYAKSLEALLFRTAFNVYQLTQFPLEASYAASYDEIGKRDLSDMMGDVAHECGLRSLWFSDAVCCCAENGNAGLCLIQYEKQGASARVAGQDSLEVSRIGSIVSERLGIRIDKWKERRRPA